MIEFDHVSKTYPGGVHAVRDLTLSVDEGETLVLLGTSGSGKTTSMKMVNRLLDPTDGQIRVDGEDVMQKDPIALRRGIGYAVQHIGLFPHMTVGDNIAVVPNLLGWDADNVDARVNDLLAMVGLEPDDFRDRMPSQLSGGQRQRIGVARALGGDPPVVLMDEPFGALDPITRETLQDEFIELEGAIQKTILFVTHDVFEAVKMGDRIALLNEGELQQIDTPHDLVDNPANDFVDQFLGHHRFQLALMTQTVGNLIEEVTEEDAQARGGEKTQEQVPIRASLVEALDTLKASGQDRAPVYDRDDFAGILTKKRLLQAINDVLGETGE